MAIKITAIKSDKKDGKIGRKRSYLFDKFHLSPIEQFSRETPSQKENKPDLKKLNRSDREWSGMYPPFCTTD
jgi:hypothetical protein